MITINKNITTLNGEDLTSFIVTVNDLHFKKIAIGKIDPFSEASELDQALSMLREIVNIEIGFYKNLEDAALKRFNNRFSYKFANVTNKFYTEMSIGDLDNQVASSYFDNIIKEHLINNGFDENEIVIS